METGIGSVEPTHGRRTFSRHVWFPPAPETQGRHVLGANKFDSRQPQRLQDGMEALCAQLAAARAAAAAAEDKARLFVTMTIMQIMVIMQQFAMMIIIMIIMIIMMRIMMIRLGCFSFLLLFIRLPSYKHMVIVYTLTIYGALRIHGTRQKYLRFARSYVVVF